MHTYIHSLHVYMRACMSACIQTGRHTDRRTDIETDRQIERQIDRQTDRQTEPRGVHVLAMCGHGGYNHSGLTPFYGLGVGAE